MHVSKAVESRQSIREYLEKPVDNQLIREILKNLQERPMEAIFSHGKFLLLTKRVWQIF
jgi:nitroreductase